MPYLSQWAVGMIVFGTFMYRSSDIFSYRYLSTSQYLALASSDSAGARCLPLEVQNTWVDPFEFPSPFRPIPSHPVPSFSSPQLACPSQPVLAHFLRDFVPIAYASPLSPPIRYPLPFSAIPAYLTCICFQSAAYSAFRPPLWSTGVTRSYESICGAGVSSIRSRVIMR